MKLFHIIADEARFGRSDVQASHQWTLPGVSCPDCGSWGGVGLSYPSVDAPELKQNSTKARWPVPIEEYRRLASLVQGRLQPQQVVRPGTQFGPLVGKVLGPVPDFAWVHWWFLLIRRNRLNELEKLGVKMPKATEADLIFQKETADLVEMEIDPLGSWDVKRLKKHHECKICGFFRDGLPERRLPSVVKSSVPQDVDLFRIRQSPAIIACNERFRDSVMQLKLTNIVFEPLAMTE